METFLLGGTAEHGRHVGLGLGLVDEDQAPGINLALVLFPLRAPAGNLGAQLLGAKYGFLKRSPSS